jgi:large subunit ribosomal protein L10
LERKTKEKVVEEFASKLNQATALFLTEYSGMKVAQVSKLRRELKHVDGEFKVIKNTLFKIASTGTSAERLQDEFVGPNGVVYCFKDPAGVAKVIASVSKDIPLFKVKAGLLGTQRLGAEDIMRLAKLPPKEILVARLLGLFKGMPQRLVGTLAANIIQLLLVLNAVKEKKEAA